MSYIIAFVAYSRTEFSKEFPVQCFRTDLKPGDKVIVRRKDGKLRNAKITQLKYLNWDCSGRIECKKEECTVNDSGSLILPKKSPIVVGLSTAGSFINALRKIGWISVKSRHRMYRAVLENQNETHIAYISIRQNGLDLRIIRRSDREGMPKDSINDGPCLDEKEVRHSLAHTNFNLYEGILRFSESFLNNESDLNRYFVPQGSKDKRTTELKEQAESRKTKANDYEDETIEVIGKYPEDMIYGYHCR